jgi:hypothetical protein
VFFSFLNDDFGVSLWVIMGKEIYIFIERLTIITFAFQLIISIKAYRNDQCPQSLKHFYWYPIVGLAIGCIFILARLDLVTRNITFFFNSLSTLFHFSFLGLIIYKATGRKKMYRYTCICIFIFLAFVFYHNNAKTSNTLIGVANLSLFLLAIFYFRYFLINETISNLKKSPVFILVCGIFIGAGLIIPYTLFNEYLLSLSTSMNNLYLYGVFSALGYLTMNLFFLKALLCIKQNK